MEGLGGCGLTAAMAHAVKGRVVERVLEHGGMGAGWFAASIAAQVPVYTGAPLLAGPLASRWEVQQIQLIAEMIRSGRDLEEAFKNLEKFVGRGVVEPSRILLISLSIKDEEGQLANALKKTLGEKKLVKLLEKSAQNPQDAALLKKILEKASEAKNQEQLKQVLGKYKRVLQHLAGDNPEEAWEEVLRNPHEYGDLVEGLFPDLELEKVEGGGIKIRLKQKTGTEEGVQEITLNENEVGDLARALEEGEAEKIEKALQGEVTDKELRSRLVQAFEEVAEGIKPEKIRKRISNDLIETTREMVQEFRNPLRRTGTLLTSPKQNKSILDEVLEQAPCMAAGLLLGTVAGSATGTLYPARIPTLRITVNTKTNTTTITGGSKTTTIG